MISCAIITGNEKRHQYFAAALSNQLDVKAVFFEQKANMHNKKDFGEEDQIVRDHFKLRDASEEKYFSIIPDLNAAEVYNINTGEINDPQWVEKIIAINPDYVLLFGSSLIKDPILDHFQNRVINLHLGLSPYYRGSGTNFWPLVHQKPECVGATIHLAVKEVDGGAILNQVRPAIEFSDSIHDLGNKTILAAVIIMQPTVEMYSKGVIKGIDQDISDSFICKRKDLTPGSIKLMYNNFDNGMIDEFLKNASGRLEKYPVVTYGD